MTRYRRLRCRTLLIAVAGALGLATWAPSAVADDGIPRPPGAIDGRGWELVTQPDKNGQQAQGGAVSQDGGRVLYGVWGGVPGATNGSPKLLAERTASGWRSRLVRPPRDQQLAHNYVPSVVAPDLSGFLAAAYEGLAGAEYGTNQHLVRLDDQQHQTLLHTFPQFEGVSFVAPVASNDLIRVYANVRERIAPSHAVGTGNVYDFGATPPTLVSTMPGTQTAPLCGVADLSLPTLRFGASSVRQHATSTDGRFLFFLSKGNTCSGEYELYVHDANTGESTLVSGPPIAGSDQGVTSFLAATPSGSQAFYITGSSLATADSSDGDDADADVYRYDTAGGVNTCITCVAPHAAVTDAMVGELGSHVYFTSTQQLLPAATVGLSNVYAVHDGTLSFAGVASQEIGPYGDEQSEVTPNGRFLLFLSDLLQMDAVSGAANGGVTQLYRYDAEHGTTTCVSCPSDAAAAIGGMVQPLTENTLLIRAAVRSMTDDGSIVVFKSLDKLLPEDQNGSADLYEWHDGELGLISDGVTPRSPQAHSPFLLTLSRDGRDVHFVDTARLTPDTEDDTQKVYDARVGGGFPPPPPPPPSCVADHCRGLPSPLPPLADPASASLLGDGNVVPGPLPAFTVSRVTAADRRRAVRRGRIPLSVRVSHPGRVSVDALARLDGRMRRVGHATASARRAGSVTLVVRLGSDARARLASRGRLRMVLVITYSESRAAKRVVLVLNGGRHAR